MQMHTVRFDVDIPRILLVKLLRPVWPGVVFSRWSPTRLESIDEPVLPGANWVRVRNRMCGICGTDLHLLLAEADPRVASAALPGRERIYLGHEVVGEVTEIGPGVTSLAVGDRVVMDSRALMAPTCLSQELEPACPRCAAGDLQLCENASVGRGPTGVGGGWGDGYTAHVSEVARVPDDIDDEAAMMMEPLAVAVRAVLAPPISQGDRVLVVGAGIVGLNVVQALRALVPASSITVLARYPHQAAAARRLGADEVVERADPYEATARITGAKLYAGAFGNRMLLGGFDVVFDCVGSAKTVHDALRWTRAGGTVVVVGISLERLRLDLSPVWAQEVRLIGVVGHGVEPWNGERRSTYDIVCELLRTGRLTTAGLVTHAYALDEWREAIRTAMDKRSGAIKVMLDLRTRPAA